MTKAFIPFTVRAMHLPKATVLAGLTLSLLLAAVPTSQAVLWKSSLYRCSVNLPEAPPRLNPWLPMGNANDPDADLTGLIGARRMDSTAYVFLGIVKLDQKPKFQLNEKTISELEKRYFGPTLGFRHTLEPIRRKDGFPAYRATGSHQYHGTSYSIVVDFVQANQAVYEVAGLTEHENEALRDPDVRSFMESFQVLK
ncbi:MAG TPA: hypothetical protein VGD78_08420 [Chthoniobacterales bacterium]